MKEIFQALSIALALGLLGLAVFPSAASSYNPISTIAPVP